MRRHKRRGVKMEGREEVEAKVEATKKTDTDLSGMAFV